MTTTDNPVHTTALSRRTVLGATAVAVIGWLPAQRAWATPASAGLEEIEELPELSGRVEIRDLSGFDHDFGQMVQAQPLAVLVTDDPNDLATIIPWARRNAIQVAANGRSGEPGLLESHSSYGQALTEGGLQIDARGFAQIHEVTTSTADVDAGVTWAELADAAAEVGARVPALPDYLRLSIGGTVSVGGLGGNVPGQGLQSDLVEWADVVTGTGEIKRVSRRSDRALFDLIRGGGGQFAIITRLGLRMLPALRTATIATLRFQDTGSFVAASRQALASGDFHHQTGSLVRDDANTRWEYSMDLGVFHNEDEVDIESLIADLGDVVSARTVVTLSYRDWAFRVDEFADAMVAGGYWSREKPWLSLLVPGNRIEDFLEEFTSALTPRDVGAGFCIVAPMPNSSIGTPMFALPASPDGVTFFLDLLCFPGQGDVGGTPGLRRNRRWYDRLVRMGGKRYIIGAIPDMSVADWRRHFGSSRYSQLRRLKRRFDPSGILTPGQRMFRS